MKKVEVIVVIITAIGIVTKHFEKNKGSVGYEMSGKK